MESNNKEDQKIIYPRFIIDKPVGRDDYGSKSQTKIASNIIRFLKENEINTNQRRVIGIEGEWGSGKSNVIEILKNELDEEYYFYIFDAWGHQEDLTRRSILEGLLSKLIKDTVLVGEKKKWENDLQTLLSRKVVKEHKKIPKLSWAFIFSLIGILFLPISKFIAELILKNNSISATTSSPGVSPTWYIYLISFLILIAPLLPLVICILVSLSKAKNGNKLKVISELFYIFKGEEITNTSEETISENEPTVRQFTNFLLDIEMNCPSKKIVIVFDNMDRLPSKKVIEIWSTIHTFFASEDCDLKTWAVVPFDDTHICSIFKDGSVEEDKLRADSYIHKTFTIVFHIAPPVLSDWKYVLSSKFKDAFGNIPPYDQNIETIFDYHYKSNPKIKPRDIICFINDLVALRNLRDDDIPLKYLAVFALKRKELLVNPFEKILSTKELLGPIFTLFENDVTLETYLSALAFNAPVEKADELLLKRTIEKALIGVGDFKKVCTRKAFIPVFNSAFYATYSPDIIYTISRLDELPQEIASLPEMQNYWKRMSDLIVKIEIFELKYVDAIKTLSIRITDFVYVEQILRFLFRNAISLNEEKGKFFYGSKYYILIAEIEELLQITWKDKKIDALLSENNVEAKEYFQFIDSAGEKYNQYKVTCDIPKINDFLTTKFTEDKISEHFSDLKLLIKDNVDLNNFVSHIINIIPTIVSSNPECQTIVKNFYDVGKILSKDGKFPFDVPESQITPILSAFPTHERAINMLLSIIKSNIAKPNPTHVQTPVITKILADTKLVKPFASDYSYYFSFSDLLNYYFLFPSVLIKDVINEITTNSDSVTGSGIEKIICKYIEIKTKIFDNDIPKVNLFLSKVNEFYDNNDFTFVFDDNSLVYGIQIIKDNYAVDNNLVNDIIKHANAFLNGLNESIWKQSFSSYESSKNFELFMTLININKYSSNKFTQNANAAYLDVMQSISLKEIPIPKGIGFWLKLYKMHIGNLTLTFKRIRDELLKPSTHGDVTIEEVLFFENGLFQYGELNQNQERADETLRLILIPLANEDESYKGILKRNPSKIKDVIETASELVVDFKIALDKRCAIIYEEPVCKPFTSILLSKVSEIEKDRYENRLIIESAKYGKNDKYKDVTQIVSGLLAEKGSLAADNSTFDCVGEKDPIQNTVKELIIEYKFKRKSKELKANEDEIIELTNVELIKKSTESSNKKQIWIQNKQRIGEYFKGEWLFTRIIKDESKTERIKIENGGKYYISGKYIYDLLVTELTDKSIKFNKINFDNNIVSIETLNIISSFLFSGNDNSNNKIEYKQIRIAVNIEVTDKEKLFKIIESQSETTGLKIESHDNSEKTDYFTLKVSEGIDLFSSFERFLKKNKIRYIDYHEI